MREGKKGEKEEVGENLAEESSQPLLKIWAPLSRTIRSRFTFYVDF